MEEGVLQLGAGIKLDKLNEVSILSAVNEIFSDSSYKQNAEKIANSFKNCSGAKGAAGKIIQCCDDTI